MKKYLVIAVILVGVGGVYYASKVSVDFNNSKAAYPETQSLVRAKRLAGPISGNCHECFCGESTEITNYFWAATFDKSEFERCITGDGNDPLVMFRTPGSQNHIVYGNIGLYLVDKDPTWLTHYLAIQRQSSGTGVGFMGGELFSTIYGNSVAASLLLAHNQALILHHADLLKETNGWLRTYWVAYALAAVPHGITRSLVYTEGGIQSNDRSKDSAVGYATALVGARSPGDGGGYNDPYEIDPMFALALNLKPRVFTRSVVQNSNLHSLGKTAIAIGLPISTNNRVDLGSLDFPAARFGLTESERATLQQFVESNGTKNLDAVMAMVSDYRPAMAITYYRTDQGVSTWFGTSTQSGHCPNPNPKGCNYATKIQGATEEYLHPNGYNTPQPPGRSWRKANKICATNYTYQQCMTLPGGTLISEISWTPDQGMIRLQ